MKIFFDTETTGVPKNYRAPVSDVENWPRLVQLGYIVTDDNLDILSSSERVIKPIGFEIPLEASSIHGISQSYAWECGAPVERVVNLFARWLEQCDTVIGHNVDFDINVVGAEYWRLHQRNPFTGLNRVCTMKSSTDFCELPGGYGGKFKWPRLSELYRTLFNEDMGKAHTALQDIGNTVKCYGALVERGVIK